MTTTEATLLSLAIAVSCMVADIMYSKEFEYISNLKLKEEKLKEEFAINDEDKIKSYIALCKRRKNCRAVAEAIYYEARSESRIGMQGVAFTILNRAMNPTRWPNTPYSVVYYKCQFSYTCDGSRKQGFKEKDKWDLANIVAYRAINRLSSDPTNGADHYYAPHRVSKPYWAKKMRKTAKLGNHVFYKS
ncbi:Spore cortex-lytic enzyme [Pseudomonas phage vB_PaeM_MIJ3]|nr:Spore cortex-lytic enzyme [Pseudomonas phage vB_PaeM_MIJ3]